jgi:hypothetical protein
MTRQQKAVFIDFNDIFTEYKFTCFSKPFIKRNGEIVNRKIETKINYNGNYIYFSIRLKNRIGFDNQGYLFRNDFIKNIQLKEIFTENIQYSSIQLIEWEDCFLVCFNDGIHIIL